MQTFLANKYELDSLYISFNSKYKNELIKNKEFDSKIYLIPNNIYHSISKLKNGDGIIAIFKIKQQENTINISQFKGIILDNNQNPQNLGSILRSAKAFNITDLYLVNNTVDLFNPKVIQTSMGNGYDLNFHFATNLVDLINNLKSQNIKVYCTEINKESLNVSRVNFKNSAVILGNEGHGVSKNIAKLCDHSLYIPINKNVDSLNVAVAGAIIMYLMNYENN